MIIITGDSGSGKTRHLISLLNHDSILMGEDRSTWIPEFENTPQEFDELVSVSLPKIYPHLSDLDVCKRTVDVDGVSKDFDVLSRSDRTAIAFVANLLSELQQTASKHVCIDNVELNIHPQDQHGYLDRLKNTFPECTWVVTTTSTTIMSDVPNAELVCMEKCVAVPMQPLYGLNVESVYAHLEWESRAKEAQLALDKVHELIYEGDFKGALKLCKSLKGTGVGNLPEFSVIEILIRRRKVLKKLSD